MNKKVAIGCGVGCLGIVVIGVITALFLVPKLFQWGENQVAMELERQKATVNWNPPKGATLDNFFPTAVDDYSLESNDDHAMIADFQFDQKGWHAVYQSNASKINVFTYQVTSLEKEALFKRVDDVYENQSGGFKSKTSLGYRMYYSSTAHHQNHFWWVKGWLFVFRTTDSKDREPFVLEFFKASSAKQETPPKDDQEPDKKIEVDKDGDEIKTQ